VAGVAAETEKLLDKVFPKRLGEAATLTEHADLTAGPALRWQPLPAPATGYVQGIDYDALLAFAEQEGVVVRMEHAIGSFVVAGGPLASAASPEDQPLPATDHLTKGLVDCYRIGNQRTLDQDVGFGLRQLVDIALKALSPGINDTTTAVMCVARLGARAHHRPRFCQLPGHGFRPDSGQCAGASGHLPAPVRGPGHGGAGLPGRG